jgi:hypothetical protein
MLKHNIVFKEKGDWRGRQIGRRVQVPGKKRWWKSNHVKKVGKVVKFRKSCDIQKSCEVVEKSREIPKKVVKSEEL